MAIIYLIFLNANYFLLSFREWKEKFDMVDHEEEDAISFRMTNRFVFRPDLSHGLTGNEIITTVHPLIMVIITFKYLFSHKINFQNIIKYW